MGRLTLGNWTRLMVGFSFFLIEAFFVGSPNSDAFIQPVKTVTSARVLTKPDSWGKELRHRETDQKRVRGHWSRFMQQVELEVVQQVKVDEKNSLGKFNKERKKALRDKEEKAKAKSETTRGNIRKKKIEYDKKIKVLEQELQKKQSDLNLKYEKLERDIERKYRERKEQIHKKNY